MLHHKENVLKKPKCLGCFSGYTNVSGTIVILRTEDWDAVESGSKNNNAGRGWVWLNLENQPPDTKNDK